MEDGSPASADTERANVSRLALAKELRSLRKQASVSSLRHNIAALDQLRGDLAEDALQETFWWVSTTTDGTDPRIKRKLNLANLLRLVDSIRADLRLVLTRVLSALSHRSHTVNFVLVLLASARRFGHRSESGDFVLPAFASISVVTGESAHAVS